MSFKNLLNVNQQRVFNSNVFKIKKYNEDLYKIVVFKKDLRSTGFEECNKGLKSEVKPKANVRLENNISRSKSLIKDIALSNDFDFFVTLTLDPTKNDDVRDLKGFIKRFNKMIRNIRARQGLDIKYLLVPELHKSGAVHFHGFLSGLSLDDELSYNEYNYLTWRRYNNNFGFMNIRDVSSNDYVYIVKSLNYMLKDIQEDNSLLDAYDKSYYCSQGLNRSKEIYEGRVNENLSSWFDDLDFFENDFVKVLDINKSDLDNIYPLLI